MILEHPLKSAQIGQIGVSLEAWRTEEGLTYEALARRLALGSPRQAQRYARGERIMPPDLMDRVMTLTRGRVTLFAMHAARREWLASHVRSQPKVGGARRARRVVPS